MRGEAGREDVPALKNGRKEPHHRKKGGVYARGGSSTWKSRKRRGG